MDNDLLKIEQLYSVYVCNARADFHSQDYQPHLYFIQSITLISSSINLF